MIKTTLFPRGAHSRSRRQISLPLITNNVIRIVTIMCKVQEWLRREQLCLGKNQIHRGCNAWAGFWRMNVGPERWVGIEAKLGLKPRFLGWCSFHKTSLFLWSWDDLLGKLEAWILRCPKWGINAAAWERPLLCSALTQYPSARPDLPGQSREEMRDNLSGRQQWRFESFKILAWPGRTAGSSCFIYPRQGEER